MFHSVFLNSMIFKIENIFICDVEGIDDSKPPNNTTEIWSVLHKIDDLPLSGRW